MFCDGQLLPISENDALFNLIGTTYGGDGQETFALPDLRGRIPIHIGNAFLLGETGGTETVTLTAQQMPSHSHAFVASSNNAAASGAAGKVLAQTPSYTPYFATPPNSPLSPNAAGAAGGSQPHENFQPYLCVDFIISLFGIFPSPT
jgi:microcystin-dependent protein